LLHQQHAGAGFNNSHASLAHGTEPLRTSPAANDPITEVSR
jgi:hypothetical protein